MDYVLCKELLHSEYVKLLLGNLDSKQDTFSQDLVKVCVRYVGIFKDYCRGRPIVKIQEIIAKHTYPE